MPDTLHAFLNQSLWANSFISIQGQPLFYRQWFEAGIFKVNNIVAPNGTFLSYKDLSFKYKLKTTFIQFFGLLKAIPPVWKAKWIGNDLQPLDNSETNPLFEERFC